MTTKDYEAMWKDLFNELYALCSDARRRQIDFPDMRGFHTVLAMMEKAEGWTFGKQSPVREESTP